MQEIHQPLWRGRSLAVRKDSKGPKHTAMIGKRAMLFIPITAKPDSVYRILVEMRKESGNGKLFCNIYANRNYDFPHVGFTCATEDWGTYDIMVPTRSFPQNLPMIFRLWRPPDGTGTVLIKRLTVELLEPGTTVRPPRLVAQLNKSSTREKKPPPAPRRRRRLRRPRPAARGSSARRAKIAKDPGAFVTNYENHNPEGARVLYLPLNSLEIRQTGMEKAFLENGFRLRVFDFRNAARARRKFMEQTFIQQVREFRPDWIHMQLQFTNLLPPSAVAQARALMPRAIITNWTGDCRSEANHYFTRMSEHVDLSLISSEGQLPLYRSAGCQNVEYWQIGVDPHTFHPLSADDRTDLKRRYRHDVAFCASNTPHYAFPASTFRRALAQAMHDRYGIRFGLYGSGWGRIGRGEVHYYKQNEVYNASKIALSVNHFNDVRMYFSDRQLITMASGAMVICHYIPGLEEYFENGKDLVWFTNRNECFQLMDHYLANPEEAAAIGARGARKVLEQHSYAARVRELAIRIGLMKSGEKSTGDFRSLYRPPNRSLRVMCYRPRIGKAGLCRRDEDGLELQMVKEDLLRNAAQFQPDWLHLHMPKGSPELPIVEAQEIREKMPNLVMTGWHAGEMSQNAAELARVLDHTFVNDAAQVNGHQEAGASRLDHWFMEEEHAGDPVSFHRRMKDMSERLVIDEPRDLQVSQPAGKKPIDMSVVMGTYNRLDMLENTVRRLLASAGGRRIEIIVNDAGSTDGTAEWLFRESQGSDIVPIFSGEKTGITNAYNEGFKIARGKYVSWFSDDVVPVGPAIRLMCELMDTLNPEDMGAYPIRDSKGAPFRVPYLLKHPAPTVGCMFTDTLREYNYWNTDYPYYGQDNEVNARVLRMGGKIVICPEAKVDHLNRQDELKHGNVSAYAARGHAQKFHLIHWRYGQREELMYPKILVVPMGVSAERVMEAVDKLRSHYMNAHYYLASKVEGIDLEEHELEHVPGSADSRTWQHYDLTVTVQADRCEVTTPNARVRGFKFAREMWK